MAKANPTNEQVDKAVLRAIRAGANRARKIKERMRMQKSVGVLVVGEVELAVDRSLQRLRKAGRATYDSASGWEVSK